MTSTERIAGLGGRDRLVSGAVPAESAAPIIADRRLAPLSRQELERYHRNALVPEVGLVGQQRIRAARILLVGAGGLGSPAGLYLAAAGVGTIGIIDDDEVDLSNLQRQVIHTTSAVGTPKADSAATAITGLNPGVEVIAQRMRVTGDNALELLDGWDLVIDGTDNFPTRYLLADATALMGIPLIHGAVLRSHGQVGVFDARRGPCYRCLHPQPPAPGSVPSCAEAGVLGVLPGIVGTMQAAEALKLIVGGGRPLIGRIQMLDVWGARIQEVAVARNPDCPLCGDHPTITALVPHEDGCPAPGTAARPHGEPGATGPGTAESAQSTATPNIQGPTAPPAMEYDEISPAELATLLAGPHAPALLDVREEVEVALDPLPGARHIPLGEVIQRADELDEGRPTVVVCAAGVRSRRAIEALRAVGYRGELINLAGGMRALHEAGQANRD
ncbi:molybdopterin-synthase adenylyltransferase MoeB [Actinomyces slackii]|uniref:Probable adenylyltransferase/sulfurtransferase MoeZ n=1 Tax=Actinomyces slackii TaxID=52774 RepID=A0A3S4SR70_9ACTO|nr:molybdopterin-synthase adenylyltransferase MoeB [Actinomyces slackii]VEG75811.1 Probable adenylyltransferase/sulfurtransferase MoeZ [Actinomyces slackii]